MDSGRSIRRISETIKESHYYTSLGSGKENSHLDVAGLEFWTFSLALISYYKYSKRNKLQRTVILLTSYKEL